MLGLMLLMSLFGDAEVSPLHRALRSGSIEHMHSTAIDALANARTQADALQPARVHVVVARAALERNEWVDAVQHSRMAYGIAVARRDHTLLRSALVPGVAALLLLDDTERASVWLNDCADLSRLDRSSPKAAQTSLHLVEAHVLLAHARAMDPEDSAGRTTALAQARRVAERAAVAACHHDVVEVLRVCAFETLVEVSLEGAENETALARAWRLRLAAGRNTAPALDNSHSPPWALSDARLDLADDVDARPILTNLLRLQTPAGVTPLDSTYEATLMRCLAEAFERCADFEQALRCRERWAAIAARQASIRAAQQSKATQRTLEQLHAEARTFVTQALPDPLHAALKHLQAAQGTASIVACGKIAQVERSTIRALEIARSYLTVLSADERQRRTLQSLDVGQVAAEACDRAQPLPASKVTIERHLEADSHVLGDAQLIGRALDNLLSNALQHAPKGSSVRVTVRRTDGMVAVSVADSGPGLPLAMRTRLFRRHATDRSGGGNGLGLALVARVASQHRARVQVQTEAGQGTEITLLFKPQ